MGTEVQEFFDTLRDSTGFWVVGACAVVIVVVSFVRGGRR